MSCYESHYDGMLAFVTGGAGAIGSNLSRRLAELGAQVIVLDNLTASEPWNLPNHDNLLFVEGDVRDEVKLKRVFFEEPDVVFHLAAFFANQNSIDHPEEDLAVNGMGTLRMLEYSVLSDIDRFIYASSGCSIYGSSAPLPLEEGFTSMHLSTPYQITKMLGELYGNFFWHHYDLEVVKARFFNSFGPGEVPGQYRNVIPNFIYWAMKGYELPITGSGQETRDFTYVDDIVDGLLRCGAREEAVGEEYNLASGRETTIQELAETVNELTDNEAGIRYASKRKWDTKDRLRASIEKARSQIGYEPRTGFEEGLQRTITWFEENWERIDRAAEFGPGVSSAVREMNVDTEA